MGKVPRKDLFDSKSVEILLEAVGVKQGTAEADPFLRRLRSAVELYRDLFPDGRPNAEREVTVRRKLLARAYRAYRSGMPAAAGYARVGHLWAVVVAEQRSFSKVGCLSSQLADQLGALSRDAKVVLTDQLFLEFSGRLRVGDVVKVLAALKAACKEFSNVDVRRTPRAHRGDIQLLVDCVVPTFVDYYTKWEKHELRADLETVLEECSPAAGVQPTGRKIKLDLRGERAWRGYVLPSLERLLKRYRRKARWESLVANL